MYFRAGLFSLGLLLLSRVLGLARESVQAAAFGSTGMGDVVIVMFTLPDLLVGIFLSGALAYVLVPHWAQQTSAAQRAGQKKIARSLALTGGVAGLLIWLLREVLVSALAPGLQGDMKALGASSLVWSAVVLPLAMLAALWTTRLQHERDFVGMYAGNLVVNGILVAALLFLAGSAAKSPATTALGLSLVAAMVARLAWLVWRLGSRRQAHVALATPISKHDDDGKDALPRVGVWLWAALSSGLLLLLPLAGRSIASQGGEGELASFNYAWKLVELPLVLAVQLVASLAFPAIARTQSDTPERAQATHLAFLLAWALACAAIAVVATFSLQLSGLLFGWGRMSPDKLALIADWSAIGVWSLLPQALIAILLTVMASSQRMHIAVWAHAAGLLGLCVVSAANVGLRGADVMWMLNAVLAGVAVMLMLSERKSVAVAFPWFGCLVPLAVCMLLTQLKPWLAGFGAPLTVIMVCVYGALVTGSAVMASPTLKNMLLGKYKGENGKPKRF